MKTFDTRTYSISDFEEWNDTGLLELSPDFQRRGVWSQKAKSYLVDTILRGKPMPKILLTESLRSKRKVRTVIDGQQRLRAIIEFLEDGFPISSAHNRELARKRFSSLEPELQDSFRNYELGCDVLHEQSYSDLLDIFARINTYTVKLNKQELLNAQFTGYFKQVAYDIGHSLAEYLVKGGVLTSAQITRMAEATLISEFLGVCIEKQLLSNKAIPRLYDQYDDAEEEVFEASERLLEVIGVIQEQYPAEELKNTAWSSAPLFFTLFSTYAHAIVGLSNVEVTRPQYRKRVLKQQRVVLDSIAAEYQEVGRSAQKSDAEEDEITFEGFVDRSRRGTADLGSRIYRCKYVAQRLENIPD